MIKNIAVVAAKQKRKYHLETSNVLIASAIAVLGLLAVSTGAKGQTVSLGSAQDFTIVSAAGMTNSGPTVISGNIALSPGTSITGFAVGEGAVTGIVHINDALAIQARTDALAAYTTLAGMTPAIESGAELGEMTLTPGVYHFSSSVSLTGKLTLDTQGNPNAVFVFQIFSTLTTAVGSSVVVTGAGAGIDPNVFWQVGSSATLNTNTAFDGNILAHDSISLGTNANIVDGRAIALTGAVTLLSNNISPAVVPEPATWVMVFGGMGTLGFWTRMRRRSNL